VVVLTSSRILLTCGQTTATSNARRLVEERMLSVAGVDIDIELDQLYRTVRSELTYDGEPGDEHPGDQDSR
jgi:hypothetical protein